MENKSLRIAIIGAGTITQSVHLTSLQRAGFDVVMVCDLSPSRAQEVAKRCDAKATTDTNDVFASDVEAVLIATPGSHARLTEEAILAGKHVIAEKPLAYTVAEVDRLEKLAKEHGVIVQVGYMKMFDPLMETARDKYSALTGVRLVQVTVMHPDDHPQVSHLRLGDAPDDADKEVIAESIVDERSRAKRALIGAGPDLLAYYMNVLNGSVIHEFSVLRALGINLPNDWHAQVVTPLSGPQPPTLLATGEADETAVVLSWKWLPEYPEYDEQVLILAGDGRIRLNMAKPYLLEERSVLEVDTNQGDLRETAKYLHGHETGFLLQLDSFARAIRSGHLEKAGLDGARKDITELQKLAKAIGASVGEEIEIEVEK